jgi:hypothetical protein
MRKIIFIFVLLAYSFNAFSEINEKTINTMIEEQTLIQSKMGVMAAVLTFCGNAEPNNKSYGLYKEGFLNYATQIAGNSSGHVSILIEKYQDKDTSDKFHNEMQKIYLNSYLEKKSELKSLSRNLLLNACSEYKHKINNNDYEIIKHAKKIFESERTDFTEVIERILDINGAYIKVEKLKLE